MPHPTASRVATAALTSVLATGLTRVQAAPAGASSAPNPGFEEGDGDRPASWSFYSWKQARGWWEHTGTRTGGHCLGLSGLNGGWSAAVPVVGGRIHDLRLHYRTNGRPSRVVFFVRVETKPRTLETILYKPVITIPSTRRGRFVDGTYVGGADDRGWVYLEAGQFAPGIDVESINLLIKIRSDDPQAQLFLDDLSVTACEPLDLPDAARLLWSGPVGKVWTEDENRKVLPDRTPPARQAEAGLSLSLARGEYGSLQIAVTPNADCEGMSWSWDPLSGASHLPQTALRCRRVELIPIEKTMGPHGHAGLNPDPLTERLPCDIAAGTNQAFWFTIRVPPAQAPGTYDTQLRLLSGAGLVCQIPLTVRVWDFVLPRRPSMDVRSSLRYNLVLPRETDDGDTVLKRYYRDYYEHRSRCSPGVRVGVRLDGDSVSVDAGECLDHLRYMRDELGAERFNIPSLWIGHRGTHRMPADAAWQRRRIFANPECTELRPEFENPFRDYMGKLLGLLREHRLFLAPVVRFFDEPNLTDQPTLNALRTLSRLLLDIEPQLTVAMTATYPHPELTDVSKLWVLHTDAWDRNLDHIDAARRAGCRIYVYNNAVNFPEHPPIRVRLWPWLLRKYGVDGTYSWWGTVCWRGEMEDPWSAGMGSSGVLLYPPRSDRENGPISSVRWELFREGLEDYEYLRLAADLADRAEHEGQAGLARQAREAAETALALVRKWPNVRAANDQPYSLDVTAVAAARERLGNCIEALSRALRRTAREAE